MAELDRLELAAGACLRVLEVETRDGARERYLWLEGDVGAALVALVAAGAERGAFRFEPAAGIAAVSGERPIGHDQSNTSIVVGEQLVAKVYRRIERGSHPEIELGSLLTEMGLDCIPAFRGARYWDGHPLVLVQDYVGGSVDGWTLTTAALRRGDAGYRGAPGRRRSPVGGRLGPPGLSRGHRCAAERLGRRRAGPGDPRHPAHVRLCPPAAGGQRRADPRPAGAAEAAAATTAGHAGARRPACRAGAAGRRRPAAGGRLRR